jgi:hypothetical protein
MGIPEQNPAQWTKFEHLGVWYAAHCQDRLNDLLVVVGVIQKWWRRRRRGGGDQPPLNEVVSKRDWRFVGKKKSVLATTPHCFNPVSSVREISQRLQRKVDPKLQQLFRAHEKLDGTNLGIRCDGAVFGRRHRIFDDTYQCIPLEGTIPTDDQVRRIKNDMLDVATYGLFDSCQLTLYGELMSNTDKFDYAQRNMGNNYYCFGAMISMECPCPQGRVRHLDAVLRRRGLNFHLVSSHDRIIYRIMLNPAFQKLLNAEGLYSAPWMTKGTLRQICMNLKNVMLEDGFEGVVLTAPIEGTFFKWKTSVQDKSGGLVALSNLCRSYSPTILESAGIDLEFVGCLIEVAMPKAGYDNPQTSSGNRGSGNNFTTTELEAAYLSALKKFDSLEVYFERKEQETISNYLQEEIVMDLYAVTRKDQTIVNKYVKSRVMVIYRAWRKQQKPGMLRF